MSDGFQRVLDQIRSVADTERGKGLQFERLMKSYFQQDPLYRDRFSDVWLLAEWTCARPDYDNVDRGIDLVAAENDGGFCAIQCKRYAPCTRIAQGDVANFILASNRADQRPGDRPGHPRGGAPLRGHRHLDTSDRNWIGKFLEERIGRYYLPLLTRRRVKSTIGRTAWITRYRIREVYQSGKVRILVITIVGGTIAATLAAIIQKKLLE